MDSLPFSAKQKLCYDVARGLAVLHACGIVHGDLKHENALIFENREKISGVPFTAKLADFGGSVMDMAFRKKSSLHMGTWPYGAPEVPIGLSADDLKQTNVY